MKQISTLILILFFSLVAKSQIIYLKAVMDGSQEVPANASTATGIVIVKYNNATRALELTGDYQNLTAAATDAHIHSPAAPGVNAAVLITLTHTGGTTGTITGFATLTLAQEIDLLTGNMYVNVHNASFSGGEIRGQLTTTTLGQTDFMTARLQGAQEVPPNSSLARGSAMILSDKGTGMVYLTGSFTGLTAAANAAHIHKANPTISGPVIIPISVTAGINGTIHVASTITPSDQAQMSGSGTYVNIHNANFPNGEIRGQLIMEEQTIYLKAVLQGSQEVPPTGSAAAGTAIARYNTATKTLELAGNYQNLSSLINAASIHSPAPVGLNAPILFPLINNGGTSGVLLVTTTLTAPQEADLLAGLMYVNVHTVNLTGGEIRGQLTTTTLGSQSYYFTGSFSGSQEVPPNGSAATGNVAVLLDKITNEVFVVANFSGLSANATDAHIHGGAAGVSGGVVVPLAATAGITGTVTGNAIVRPSFADSMVLGLAYVNIHDALFPNGELRAQLGNLVLPVKLSYFNGFKQNNKVTLLWESEEELNLKQYVVEQQSNEPGKWITRASVAAKGGNSKTKYSLLDEPMVTGANYVIYRLKMIDIDGKFAYSPSIKINIKTSKAALSISTNPVTDGLLRFIITGLQTNKKAEVSIIDYSGRVVAKTTAASLSNNSINIAKLPAGMYRLIVMVDENILQQSFTK